MKTRIVTAIITALALNSCMTTTSTSKDGTVTTVKSADPAAVSLARMTLSEYLAMKKAEREAGGKVSAEK